MITRYRKTYVFGVLVILLLIYACFLKGKTQKAKLGLHIYLLMSPGATSLFRQPGTRRERGVRANLPLLS